MEISTSESRRFRQARLLWFPLATLLIALALVAPSSLWLWAVAAIWFGLSAYVFFWPCPRCGRAYSLRLFYGVVGITWPWTNECLHCGARLNR